MNGFMGRFTHRKKPAVRHSGINIETKRVVYLLLNLSIGGAERLSVDLANEISEDSKCTFYLAEDLTTENLYYKSSLKEHVEVKPFRFRDSLVLRYVYEIFRIILREKPTVIHIHSPSLIFPLLPAVLVFGRRVKFVQTVHSNPLYIRYKLKRLIVPILALVYRSKLITTVAVSHATSAQFSSLFGVPCSTVIYNARFNLDVSSKLDQVKVEINDQLNSGDIVLFHIGRYAEVKNQKMLVEVVNQLISQGYPIKLFIIGNNFAGSGLIELAHKRICFLGDRINVIDYLSLADGLCISSKSEAMPLVLIEAMSVGCMPIATKVGGIGEIIEDGMNGFLSSEVSFDCYYQTMIRFLNNRQSISKPKIQFDYLRFFSPQLCVNSYKSIYFNK